MNKIILTVTADWEGEHFKNLNDFLGVRKFIGREIPVTHFITASYFTKKKHNAQDKILSVLYDYDEIALHIHCLRSLVHEAGVAFIDSPDFFEPFTPEVRYIINLMPKMLKPMVSGRGVPISAYPEKDIYSLLQCSKELLEKHLSADICSFRAGGWMASDAVLRSLIKLNFKYDSSAAPPEILSQGYSCESKGNFKDEHGGNNGIFTDYILKIWGKDIQNQHFISNHLSHRFCPDSYIRKTTQPYKILSLTEMPNNAGVSDYASVAKSMMFLVKWGIGELQNGRTKPFFINLGFHQEGDLAYKLPIIDFFKALTPEEREYIHFCTLKEAGEIADKFIE